MSDEIKHEIIRVDFGGDKVYKLHFQEFNEDIDIDSLTQINYNNIYAELITISSLMNRLGVWKAQSEQAFSESKLDLGITEARKSEHYRNNLKKTDSDKVKYPTIREVDNAVTLDQDVQTRRRKMIRMRKEADYMDALYWAIKDKASKLDKISESMKLSPEIFSQELVENKINGILIKAYKKKYHK